ncbi:hypothetical protein QVD17_01879 [Tagetes erecta]|uniref:Uncharacterized protein n=1 Tax=Tagetes erecta TaxID=13708 RepID=A0AAD8L8B2_TARER|nr:hypothetical protein QVD17_01879 [Tagetes erecta]
MKLSPVVSARVRHTCKSVQLRHCTSTLFTRLGYREVQYTCQNPKRAALMHRSREILEQVKIYNGKEYWLLEGSYVHCYHAKSNMKVKNTRMWS